MRKNVETGALSGICVLVTEAPPRVRRRQTVELVQVLRPRTVAIRHVTGHQLIALIEIVSRANKDRSRHVERLRQMPPTRSNKAYT